MFSQNSRQMPTEHGSHTLTQRVNHRLQQAPKGSVTDALSSRAWHERNPPAAQVVCIV
jgi:hypothetical protein